MHLREVLIQAGPDLNRRPPRPRSAATLAGLPRVRLTSVLTLSHCQFASLAEGELELDWGEPAEGTLTSPTVVGLLHPADHPRWRAQLVPGLSGRQRGHGVLLRAAPEERPRSQALENSCPLPGCPDSFVFLPSCSRSARDHNRSVETRKDTPARFWERVFTGDSTASPVTWAWPGGGDGTRTHGLYIAKVWLSVF